MFKNDQYQIPFCIISREIQVEAMYISLEFKNESLKLKYDHVCEVEKSIFAYFRSEEDARLAARGNNWRFIK